jgi:hypothetical protein
MMKGALAAPHLLTLAQCRKRSLFEREGRLAIIREEMYRNLITLYGGK